MSDLQKIWNRQKKFDKFFVDTVAKDLKIYDEDCTVEARELRTKELAYHMIRELTELIEETNSKPHVLSKKEVNKQNIIEEYIDIFKYFINIGLTWGIEADDVIKEFERKSTVVEQKFNQELMLRKLTSDDKIAAIDIDGVLAAYPQSVFDWALTNNLISRSYETVDEFLFDRHSFAEWHAIKHKYRSMGGKQFAKLLPGAKELLDTLRGLGFKIVLLTARPYQKYIRIFADTIAWLKMNELHFDAIIFNRDKEDVVLSRFPNNVHIFVDDDAANVLKVAKAGVNLCYVVGSTVGSYQFHDNVLYAHDNFGVIASINDLKGTL